MLMYISNKTRRHGHPAETLIGAVMAAFGTISIWFVRARQRHALAALDRRMLDDIGITEKQRRAEVAKPFWWR